MNNQNKVNLILFIAQSFSDEQCANILASFPEKIANKNLAVCNSAQWNESEHPRDKKGQFTEKLKGAWRKTSEAIGEMTGISDAIDDYLEAKKTSERTQKRLEGNYSDDILKYGITPKHYHDKESEIKRRVAEYKGKRLSGRKNGLTMLEYLQRDLVRYSEEAGWERKSINDEWQPNEAKRKQLEILEMLKKAEEIEGITPEDHKKKNQERYKRYLDVDDEIDHIEEMYGDRDKGVGMKWPESKDADADRKRYKKLIRERKRLKEQINWDEVEDEDEDDDDE